MNDFDSRSGRQVLPFGSFFFIGNFFEIPYEKTLREDAHTAESKFTKLEKTSRSTLFH